MPQFALRGVAVTGVSTTSSSPLIDIHTLEDRPARLELNDIARVRLRLSEPLAVDPARRTAPRARSS